jgi:hypothetical protein
MTSTVATLIIAILTIVLAGVAIRFAVVDARADREHAKWMRRNELRRRRTQVEVAGISRGYRGTGLDARTRPLSDRARR